MIRDEDRWLIAKCRDVIRLGQKAPHFLGFLDEREATVAQRILREEWCENALLWGGYEGAERVMMGVFPDYQPADPSFFPIVGVTARYRVEDKLTHRDFLGAFLGAGVQRQALGDILPEEGRCVLFLKEDTATFLLTQVEKVGRTGVRLQPGFCEPLPQAHAFVPCDGVIASPRLDCITAFLLGVSREKAASCIRAGGVQVNHEPCQDLSRLIQEGDLLSIRSRGRFCIDRLGPPTKKGRLGVAARRYV